MMYFRTKSNGTFNPWETVITDKRGFAGHTRPTGVTAGTMFFDTTIGKPIWWSGAEWRDANGTNV
ncbi:hypothetical protein F6Y05_02555 [Bacillus megaterium]|nr:hypothetical protein [Priestia megaterium]